MIVARLCGFYQCSHQNFAIGGTCTSGLRRASLRKINPPSFFTVYRSINVILLSGVLYLACFRNIIFL